MAGVLTSQFKSSSHNSLVVGTIRVPLIRQIQGVGDMNRAGFTLVEVVIVIVLIGILTAFAAPRIGSAIDRRSINGARVAITTLNAKARAVAVQRGRPTMLVRNGDTFLILARRPLTGAEDTVDVRNMYDAFKVTIGASPRDSLLYDPRGLGLQNSTSSFFIMRSGYADTVRIGAIGGLIP